MSRVVVVLLIGGRLAGGQVPQPNTDTTPVPWGQLSQTPQLRAVERAAGIRYPSMLQTATVAGDVRLDLVVGEDGKPRMPQTRVITSTHDLFTNSVRRAAAVWEFTPPMLDGRTARATVPVWVYFLLPEDHDVPVREVATVATDSLGLRIRLGWESVPRETTVAAATADLTSAKTVVLLQLLSLMRDVDSAAATCVRWSDKPRQPVPPPVTVMRRLRRDYPEVLSPDRCPRTYASMMQRVDSLGPPVRRRPRGAVDPVWVVVGAVQPWTSNLFLVQGYVSQGTGWHNYRCEASRDERGGWFASCELRSTEMS